MKYFSILLILFSSFLLGNEYYYCFEGLFENENDQHGLIQKIISRDDTILEAGAFDGSDTLWLSQMVPNGKLFSFEPNPTRFQELVSKTYLLPNVEAYPFALGEKNENRIFYVCHGFQNDRCYEGASSLLPPVDEMKLNYQGPRIDVPCVILDDWCARKNVKKIDFMWLDMEGFELQMLKSSPNILKTVKVIFVETNFFEFREGMTLYPFLRDFLYNNGFRLLSHWYYKGRQGNAVFVRSDCLGEIIKKLW